MQYKISRARADPVQRAERFVGDWRQFKGAREELRRGGDTQAANRIAGRMAEMAKDLEGYPQVELQLRGKARELGIGWAPARVSLKNSVRRWADNAAATLAWAFRRKPMDQTELKEDLELEADPAAEAFGRLERELALMRRAVEHRAAERADIVIPDYDPTLVKLPANLAALGRGLIQIERLASWLERLGR